MRNLCKRLSIIAFTLPLLFLTTLVSCKSKDKYSALKKEYEEYLNEVKLCKNLYLNEEITIEENLDYEKYTILCEEDLNFWSHVHAYDLNNVHFFRFQPEYDEFGELKPYYFLITGADDIKYTISFYDEGSLITYNEDTLPIDDHNNPIYKLDLNYDSSHFVSSINNSFAAAWNPFYSYLSRGYPKFGYNNYSPVNKTNTSYDNGTYFYVPLDSSIDDFVYIAVSTDSHTFPNPLKMVVSETPFEVEKPLPINEDIALLEHSTNNGYSSTVDIGLSSIKYEYAHDALISEFTMYRYLNFTAEETSKFYLSFLWEENDFYAKNIFLFVYQSKEDRENDNYIRKINYSTLPILNENKVPINSDDISYNSILYNNFELEKGETLYFKLALDMRSNYIEKLIDYKQYVSHITAYVHKEQKNFYDM